MRVGLIQADGKMPNLALMKLASWHKKRGDDVTVIDLSHSEFDRLYGSKIFVGGSGVDLSSELPEEIEIEIPDYEKFKTDYSIGFTSRGCIRNCDFCVVREKEGAIRDVPFIDWIRHQKVIIMDGNFLASPKCKEKLQYFIDNKLKVNFNQGVDVRLIADDEELAILLSKVQYYDWRFRYRRIHIAWDRLEDEDIVFLGIDKLVLHITPNRIFCYMLVMEDAKIDQYLYMIKKLLDYGITPFIMIYNNRKDQPLIRHLARWINQRFYEFLTWKEYCNRKIGGGR